MILCMIFYRIYEGCFRPYGYVTFSSCRRKMQKSKDISATNGSAAAGATSGETVELRDSRSPSRENGPPRESTTFKDPAYDI